MISNKNALVHCRTNYIPFKVDSVVAAEADVAAVEQGDLENAAFSR